MAASLKPHLSVWLKSPLQEKRSASCEETNSLAPIRAARATASSSLAPFLTTPPRWLSRYRFTPTPAQPVHFQQWGNLDREQLAILSRTSQGDRHSSRFNTTAPLALERPPQADTYPAKQTNGNASGYAQQTPKASKKATLRASRSFGFSYGYGLVDAAAAVAQSIGLSRFANLADRGGNYWGADLINAPEVWAQGYTGQGIVVAVIDSGIDYTHPDLQSNIWVNRNEIPDNGIDDDSNGFIDDVRGWSFVDTDSNNPMDLDSHGTHVAGTIAAANNGFGVTGIAYDAKIMPIRAIGGKDDRSLAKFDANVAAGIRYAVQNGANVISMSIGSNPGNAPMRQTEAALKYARQVGAIAVMAAGNERRSGTRRPIEPAFYAMKDLGIAVGAVGKNKTVADFSNPAGNKRLDFVVAPGINVESTLPNGLYDRYSGTSMATPHVAGVVALMLSANPNLTPTQVETILTSTSVRSGIKAV
ncbi:S8 family serine peptidase [Oculatella sp. LEGE 06141]|uniref:S8 family peptidase n=1 Tax=Oculatella sp. LEGE 06141 TaxID=1828648 RepID=UPI001881C5E9|nr:S8 family peptidase [Oculatella sp. LEGE 06141]MBE9177887.1 S8 family serine peptidase [Oculatella sp. LEGE 06141]